MYIDKTKIIETQKKLRAALAKGNKSLVTRYTNQLKKLRGEI